ncbi:MAG: dUTPase family [Mycoplasmataceae bacterium RC_NB112A]|nr:MAG: dUTPase family [Mycoplasmataceae bacterium RC_NB112A]
MKIISELFFNRLKKEQTELDRFIYSQSSIQFEWISLWNAKRLKLALFTEVAEFANELRTFKIWAKKKPINENKVKEELIDCLCFFLGLVNFYQINFADISFSAFPKNQGINKGYEIMKGASLSETYSWAKSKVIDLFQEYPTVKPAQLNHLWKNFSSWEDKLTILNSSSEVVEFIQQLETALLNDLLLDFFAKTHSLALIEDPDLYPHQKELYRNFTLAQLKTYQEWLIVFQHCCQKVKIEKEEELLSIYLNKKKVNLERER